MPKPKRPRRALGQPTQTVKKPKTPANRLRYNRERMARIVAARRAANRCVRCCEPVATRVILHPDGTEAERRTLTECVACLMLRRRTR